MGRFTLKFGTQGRRKISDLFSKVLKKQGKSTEKKVENLTAQDKTDFKKWSDSYKQEARKLFDFSAFFEVGANVWNELENCKGKSDAYEGYIDKGAKEIQKLASFKQSPIGSSKIDDDCLNNPNKHVHVNSIKELVQKLKDAAQEYGELCKKCDEVSYFYSSLLESGDKVSKKDYAGLKGDAEKKRLNVDQKVKQCNTIYADIGGIYTNAMAVCFNGGRKGAEVKLRSALGSILSI